MLPPPLPLCSGAETYWRGTAPCPFAPLPAGLPGRVGYLPRTALRRRTAVVVPYAAPGGRCCPDPDRDTWPPCWVFLVPAYKFPFRSIPASTLQYDAPAGRSK